MTIEVDKSDLLQLGEPRHEATVAPGQKLVYRLDKSGTVAQILGTQEGGTVTIYERLYTSKTEIARVQLRDGDFFSQGRHRFSGRRATKP